MYEVHQDRGLSSRVHINMQKLVEADQEGDIGEEQNPALINPLTTALIVVIVIIVMERKPLLHHPLNNDQ